MPDRCTERWQDRIGSAGPRASSAYASSARRGWRAATLTYSGAESCGQERSDSPTAWTHDRGRRRWRRRSSRSVSPQETRAPSHVSSRWDVPPISERSASSSAFGGRIVSSSGPHRSTRSSIDWLDDLEKPARAGSVGEGEVSPLGDLRAGASDRLLGEGDRREVAEVVGQVVGLVHDEVDPVGADAHPVEERAADVRVEEERIRRRDETSSPGEFLREFVGAEVLLPG